MEYLSHESSDNQGDMKQNSFHDLNFLKSENYMKGGMSSYQPGWVTFSLPDSGGKMIAK